MFKKISSKYKVSKFAPTLVDSIIDNPSIVMYVDITNKETETLYNTIYGTLYMFLQKLPNSPAKKYVKELLDRKKILIGSNQLRKKEGFFSRILDDVSAGRLDYIVLDMKDFDISITLQDDNYYLEGSIRNPDEMIYGSYFSYIRSACILNKTLIHNDKKIHELMSKYFYLVILNVLKRNSIESEKQKFFLKVILSYCYYKYYLKEKHGFAVKRVRDTLGIENKDLFNEFSEMFTYIEKYDNIKDIPKMLIDTNVIRDINPNEFIINLLKNYKSYGFYSIMGSLDMLIAMAVVTKYPFDILSTVKVMNRGLQDDIEIHMDKNYLKKVKLS